MASDSEHNDDKTQTHVVLTKGTMVAHYRIVEKIGAGGMGEVYLAEDTQLDRKVALKFLPTHLCQDEDCRARFKREAQAAAKLSHPNIVTIHEVGEHQNRPFFVMEHIEGRSLHDVKSEELDIDRIVGIAIQLCDGLQTAHAAGITHRDIKPSNIVIDSTGRPKLLDFGLALVKGGKHLTKTGSTLGTVGYMAPEQIEGKATDARSDLFSLGVVLYGLITGKAPFKRNDETATLKAILHDTPEPLARYKSDVPDDLQRIITKLLEKDPTLRYQSAAGVIPDLKKLSPSRTSSIVFEKKRDWWNRYIVPIAVAILLVVLGSWYFGGRDQTAPTADDRIMLAVLPFENLGDPEDEYFADGITDEITSRLSEISNLGIISRTSAYAYRNSDLTMPEIAEALGVQFVLEGTIRWHRSDSLNRVRIIPQLIDVRKDMHVWSSRYDREVTDILGLQAEIATTVANELGASLSDESKTSALVVDPEAYQYYLMGIAYLNDRTYEAARSTFLQAVSLDSTFAKAYAGLSEAISNFDFWSNRELLTSDERQMALQMAERALQLEPELVQGLRALGTYYSLVKWDHHTALNYLNRALVIDPEDGATNFTVGSLYLHVSEYQKALAHLELALKVDPTHEYCAQKIARTYLFLRKYGEAKSVLRRALSFSPNSNDLWAFLAHTVYVESGSPEELKQVIDEAYRNIPNFYSPGNKLLIPDVYDMIQGDYATVVKRIEDRGLAVYVTRSGDQINTGAYYIYLALVCHYGGWEDKARACADTASKILEDRLSNLNYSNEPAGARLSWLKSDLAAAYAILGRLDSAIALVDQVLLTDPLRLDGYQGPWAMHNSAMDLILAGEDDRAIDILDTLLQVPAPVSVPWMKVEPFLTPLRDHPRFKALIEKYENKHE